MAVEAPQKASEALSRRHQKYEEAGVPVARRAPQTVAGQRMGTEGLARELRHIKEQHRIEEEKRQELRQRALELRKQGHTYRTIGTQLDISESTAHRWVRRALEAIAAPEAEEIIHMELERLEGLYLMSYTALAKSVQMSNGEDPHLGAMDRCLAIMRQKARLLGITDQQGNVTMVLGDQSINVDQSTTTNNIIAAGSKDEYIAALARAREAHGENVGMPGTITPDLIPQPVAIEDGTVVEAEVIDEEEDE